jgi:serine/threonine protein kinase
MRIRIGISTGLTIQGCRGIRNLSQSNFEPTIQQGRSGTSRHPRMQTEFRSAHCPSEPRSPSSEWCGFQATITSTVQTGALYGDLTDRNFTSPDGSYTIEFGTLLGRGRFGIVYSLRSPGNGTLAVKLGVVEDLSREARILHKLNNTEMSPNIYALGESSFTQPIDRWWGDRSWSYIVMDRLPMPIYEYIESSEPRVPFTAGIKLLKQYTELLLKLHRDYRVCHCDAHSSNVMIDQISDDPD